MSTPRDNVGLLTRSAVLTRMGTPALTMIWVTSPSINAIIFSIQGSVIYLQSSLVVYVVLFNNKICCLKKSCFLLYHKELWSFDIMLYICSLFGKWIDFLNYVHIIKMCFFPFDLQKSCKYKQSQQKLVSVLLEFLQFSIFLLSEFPDPRGFDAFWSILTENLAPGGGAFDSPWQQSMSNPHVRPGGGQLTGS